MKECEIGIADLSDHNVIKLKIDLNTRKKNTLWRLNVGILNNKEIVKQIKNYIKLYIEENDTGEVNPVIVWDAAKAVTRGEVIAMTAAAFKKAKLATYDKLVKELRVLEHKHKSNRDSKTLKQMKEIRGQINDTLKSELEKKLRYVKQSYYESGPKSTKMLACRLKKQQALNTVYKIQDPTTKQLVYEPEKIEVIFENYFKSLYS